MASLLQLKGRIKAAQNVSKTTKAMQMIAASKLKRAQDAALSARPYVEKLTTLSNQVVSRVDTDQVHPYMKNAATSGKTLLVVLSPDKGLCGGLITNLLREFLNYTKISPENSYIVVGKKLETQVTRLEKEVIASFRFGTITPTFDMVYPISRLIDDYFLSGKVDGVKILGTHFTSVFTQTPKITVLLPITGAQLQENKTEPFTLFEPSVEEILPSLLKHYLEMTIYQHLLESFVSEQASRMIAMQNATDNATDIIDDLKLEYNKTRQTKITSEILDITGTKAQ